MDILFSHKEDFVMHYLLDFWNWSGLTPEKYAKDGMPAGLSEFEYPMFDRLLNVTKQLIHKPRNTRKELMDILTVMALDNETEDVLDYLVQHCPESKAKILVDVGMHHPLPNARWQLAEFLYRRRVDDFTTFLQRFPMLTASSICPMRTLKH